MEWKRKAILSKLYYESADIVFIQEAHFTCIQEANRMINKFWKGRHFWSFGTNLSRGVGILLAKDLNYKLLKHEFDFDGRTVIVDIEMGNMKLRLMCCYAPNCPTERRKYINDLDIYLINNFENILGGDWNFVENIELDKWGGNLDNGDSGKIQMNKLKADFLLVDAFRARYPNRIEHTWRREDIHCRLDRWYIPENMRIWVDNVKHTYCSESDHFYTILNFKGFNNEIGRFGPGYWKHNTKVYEDPNFVAELTFLWERKLSQNVLKDDFWWENCKVEFKKLIIKYSRKLSDHTRKQIGALEEAAHSFLSWIAFSQDPVIIQQSEEALKQIKSELNDILVSKFEGAMIRTRAKLLEQGEKPTRYFLQMEKTVAKSKLIREVKMGENRVITEPAGIIREVRNFWKDIFKSEQVDDLAMDFFLTDTGLPRVPPHLVEHCEGPLSVREAGQALAAMKNGKSPGSDGLGCEFYKKFWHLFGEAFVAMVNLCFLNGQLTESQRLALITLLCKDKSLHYLLKHWRPISLINVDAKIISKSISNRLKKVLPFIISEDQTCSVEGRSISDNIHLLRNVFDYVESKNIGCACIGLDQKKAFDRVEHKWLMKVLDYFGFGPDFKKWITVLYTNLKSSVIINGHISEEFDYERGVKQGCPLSPLLYILVIEPFSNRVRSDLAIRGLDLPGDERQTKIIQYADDSHMILMDTKSISRALTLFEIFERASGSQRNTDKCHAIWLGKFRDRADTPFGLKWGSYKKLLGIIMGSGETRDHMQQNWGKVFSSFLLTLRENFSRSCSLYGRALVANTLAVSTIVYTASHITMPVDFCKQFTKKLFHFIWSRPENSKKGPWEPIKRETLYAPAKEGGINLVCIKTKCEALLIKHIFNLIAFSYSDYRPKWMAFSIYWIGLGLRDFNSDFASNLIPHCMDYRPSFYEKSYALFKNYIEKFPMQNPANSRTVKQIYLDLMQDVVVKPRIENNVNFQNIDFRPIWTTCKTNFFDPELKTFRFKVAHGILPLNAMLFRFHISRDHNCTFCNRVDSPETAEHFFISCPQICKLWEFVTPILFKLCNHRLKIDKESVLFCKLPKNMSAISKDMVQYVIALAMFAAWKTRNSILANRGNFGSNRGGGSGVMSALDFFKKHLKFRMRADFSRYRDFRILEYHWAKNEAFCKISEGGDSLEFLF